MSIYPTSIAIEILTRMGDIRSFQARIQIVDSLAPKWRMLLVGPLDSAVTELTSLGDSKCTQS